MPFLPTEQQNCLFSAPPFICSASGTGFLAAGYFSDGGMKGCRVQTDKGSLYYSNIKSDFYNTPSFLSIKVCFSLPIPKVPPQQPGSSEAATLLLLRNHSLYGRGSIFLHTQKIVESLLRPGNQQYLKTLTNRKASVHVILL